MTGRTVHTTPDVQTEDRDFSAGPPDDGTATPAPRSTLELLLIVLAAPEAQVDRSSSITATGGVTAPPRPVDDTPRASVLTPQQASVVLAARDAALLVVAMGGMLRLGAGDATTLTTDDVGRVRRLATVMHRTLPPSVRAGIRERAARMTLTALPRMTPDAQPDGW